MESSRLGSWCHRRTLSMFLIDLELRDRVAKLTLQIEATDRKKDEKSDLAVRVFELSQDLRRKWLTADYAEKRRLLNFVCLNFTLRSVSLEITMRRPFDDLIEPPLVFNSGEGEIRTPVTFRSTGFRNRRIQPLCHLSKRDRKLSRWQSIRQKPRVSVQAFPCCNHPGRFFSNAGSSGF